MPRILLVDDRESNLDILAIMLSSLDANLLVLMSQNGLEAYHTAVKTQPDLILMDWQMPVMDGIEATRKLKNDPLTTDIPVIMTTGVMMTADHLSMALQVGAVDFLRKPISGVELAARINSALRLSKSYKEIKKQREELEILNRTKDKFFNIIARDLKDPFNAMIGLSDLMMRRIDVMDTRRLKAFVQLLNESSQMGYNLLENLMQWAKLQTNEVDFQPRRIDLSTIIQSSLHMIARVINDKQVRNVSDVESEIFVFADENMLNLVYRNLLSNAIKFTPSGSTIDLGVRLENGRAISWITDHGMGISPDDQNKLFRIDIKRSTLEGQGQKGSGLGLILVKELLLMNKGRIWFESQKGIGSTFYFDLPLAISAQ